MEQFESTRLVQALNDGTSGSLLMFGSTATKYSLQRDAFERDGFELRGQYVADGARLIHLVVTALANQRQVSLSERLSQLGKLQEHDRITAEARREVEAWRASTAGMVRKHLDTLIQKAQRPESRSEVASLHRFIEDREILSDVMSDDSAEVRLRLEHPTAGDPLLRVLESEALSLRLAKFLGGNKFHDHAPITSAKAKLAELAVPEFGPFSSLIIAYNQLADSAREEVGQWTVQAPFHAVEATDRIAAGIGS